MTRVVEHSVTREIPAAPWFLHPEVVGAHGWCLQDAIEDLVIEDIALLNRAGASVLTDPLL
jgi:hypothetical protein